MRQVCLKLSDGEVKIVEVPPPILGPSVVLVRNHFSVISAGTEKGTIKAARKTLLGKAKERPGEVKGALDLLRKRGPVQMYRAIMKRLEAYSAMGYSCAGEVIEVGESVRAFATGDLAACAGVGYANHAEVVAVPLNLCVKLPVDADLRKAAYNSLGAIAMQGIRQADVRLGESCAVIGLGLIGQLVCLMLQASGVKVVGVDIDVAAVGAAQDHGADLALVRSTPGIVETIREFTGGLGLDAVIITAATSSLGPVNCAGEIARRKGKVVVVGNVPTGFDRGPYYRKELELRMSCSYGPGRYDFNYEEEGVDYPPAYVRWTENRNMAAFQELVYSGRVDIEHLTTHEFPLEEATKAYEIIANRTEPYLGVVLRYNVERPFRRKKVTVLRPKVAGKVSLAFVGAGSYAQGSLLPNIPRNDPDVVLKGVMTSSGTTSKRVAERFGFEFCTSNESDIFQNGDINTVFIATRHDSHADYVLKALQAGKHVFVEKPLAMNADELGRIRDVLTRATEEAGSPLVMVGFNRRFAHLATRLREELGDGSMSMIYRINAGAIPSETWIQNPDIGGGRIIGEACHFVDFLTFVCGSLPKRVFAAAVPQPENLNDVVNISLEFENGSIGTISYFANGAKSLPKEYIEIYRAGMTGIIKNFKLLEVHGAERRVRKRRWGQDKGQRLMIHEFIAAVKHGRLSPIPFEDLCATSLATFKALESLQRHEALAIAD